MTYLHADYGNPYDYMNERMEKSEYINDYRLKLNNELKRALVNHGISINMLDTFIKIFEFSYFEGCDEAIELADKLDISKLHLISHRDDADVRDLIEQEIYENMEA